MPTVTSSFAVTCGATAKLFPIVSAFFFSVGIAQANMFPVTPITGTATGKATAQAYSPRITFSVSCGATCIAVGSAGIPNWPSGVPYAPLTESWQKSGFFLEPLATDMESGNQRLRSKPGSGVQMLQFDIMMTLAQAQTFESWCRNALGMGASRFQMLVWLGNGFSTQTVQFEKGKSPSPVAIPPSKVRISMSLRVFL